MEIFYSYYTQAQYDSSDLHNRKKDLIVIELSFLLEPLTTNPTLYLLMSSISTLTCNAQLLYSAFFQASNLTKDQVWLFSSELNSYSIAFLQYKVFYPR